MKQKNRRKQSKGFTLIEMMVVIAIIAALAAFGLPKYQKALARAKMVDAVSALASAAGQTAVACSLQNTSALPTVKNFAQSPNGYSEIKAAGDCTNWEIWVEAGTSNLPLPVLSAKPTADKNGVQFGWKAVSGLESSDVPAPGTLYTTTRGTGSSSSSSSSSGSQPSGSQG